MFLLCAFSWERQLEEDEISFLTLLLEILGILEILEILVILEIQGNYYWLIDDVAFWLIHVAFLIILCSLLKSVIRMSHVTWEMFFKTAAAYCF